MPLLVAAIITNYASTGTDDNGNCTLTYDPDTIASNNIAVRASSKEEQAAFFSLPFPEHDYFLPPSHDNPAPVKTIPPFRIQARDRFRGIGVRNFKTSR